MPPAISVVIPLYNKFDYIERCLKSVRAQTFTDYQLIVVNDGSTDGGEKLVEAFLQDGDELIHKERGDYPAVRNWGFSAAEGAVIASLDADDEWLPHHLAGIHELSEAFPEAALFGTGIRTYRSRFFQDRYVSGGAPRLVNYFRVGVTAGPCNCSSAAFRTEVFHQLGGFRINEPVGADLEFWARVALRRPMALHPQVSSVVHRAASTSKVRSAGLARCGPEVALGMLETALEEGAVPTELEADVRAYVAACRVRRVKFLLGSGLVKSAAETLRHNNTLDPAVRGSIGPLRAMTTIASAFPDASRPAAVVGRALLAATQSPLRLGYALMGKPRRDGELIFREGFASRV